jgi:hypothetical protein
VARVAIGAGLVDGHRDRGERRHVEEEDLGGGDLEDLAEASRAFRQRPRDQAPERIGDLAGAAERRAGDGTGERAVTRIEGEEGALAFEERVERTALDGDAAQEIDRGIPRRDALSGGGLPGT